VATEQDAARDAVLAARADLATQLELLEASGRAAIDIPAKVRRSPAKAAAVAGGLGFLVLKGPQRVIRLGRRAVRGEPAPMPKAVLPKDVDRHLRSLGDDGEAVRRVLERDFLQYSKAARRQREGLRTIIAVGVARPLLMGVSKAVARALFAPQEDDFARRLAEVRARAEQRLSLGRQEAPSSAPADDAPSA
jgi:hypothetical protein